MTGPFENEPEFRKLIARRDDVDLVALLLELARDRYADLDPVASLDELDRLARRAKQFLDQTAGSQAPAEARLSAISDFLYREEGFHGNEQSYYDPRNSYLNEVLSRRCGIPITLSIVYTVVAGRAGVPVFGVGTPGHFVVGCEDDGRVLYVDSFSEGEVLDETACRARIERILGQDGVLSSGDFRPATPLEIGTRVLRNLKTAYALENDWAEMLPVQMRLATLLPEVRDEQRDLGLIYLRNGDARPAVPLLEAYLQEAGDDEREAVLPFLKTARRMAAELN